MKIVNGLAALLLLAACKPVSPVDLGNKATASFTVTPVAGKINTFLLQSTSQNSFTYQWDKGNGNFAKGKAIDTAYFALKGNYTIKLRAFGRGGYDSAAASVSVTVDDVLSNPIFQQLTAVSWKLDPTPGANAIIVGTEGNPSQYFPGGALADCQKDDVYTFSTTLKLNYQSNGATFNGGNISPNFNCGSDRSYTDQSFGFAPGTDAGAGLATITIASAVPARFIGVTDISSNNYRIIAITPTTMVLRSGTVTEAVHQFKFIAQ